MKTTGRHLLPAAAVLLAGLLCIAACDDTGLTTVTVTYSLGSRFDLQASTSLTIVRVDPTDSSEYNDHRDDLDEVRDAVFKGTLVNNSGCAAEVSIYLSTELAASIPSGAVEVAEVSVPGTSGAQLEIGSGALTPVGGSTINSYVETGEPFYVYLLAEGQGCTNIDLTILNPRIVVTLEYDLL